MKFSAVLFFAAGVYQAAASGISKTMCNVACSALADTPKQICQAACAALAVVEEDPAYGPRYLNDGNVIFEKTSA